MKSAEEQSGAVMRESRQKKRARRDRKEEATKEISDKTKIKQQAADEAMKFQQQKQADKLRDSVEKYSATPVINSIHHHTENAYQQIVENAKESAAKAANPIPRNDEFTGHSMKQPESYSTFNEKNKKKEARAQIEKTGKFVEKQNIEKRGRERDAKTADRTRLSMESEKRGKADNRARLKKIDQDDRAAMEEAQRSHAENMEKIKKMKKDEDEASSRASRFIDSQRVSSDELKRHHEERSVKSSDRERRTREERKKFAPPEDDYQNTDAGEWKVDEERSHKRNDKEKYARESLSSTLAHSRDERHREIELDRQREAERKGRLDEIQKHEKRERKRLDRREEEERKREKHAMIEEKHQESKLMSDDHREREHKKMRTMADQSMNNAMSPALYPPLSDKDKAAIGKKRQEVKGFFRGTTANEEEKKEKREEKKEEKVVEKKAEKKAEKHVDMDVVEKSISNKLKPFQTVFIFLALSFAAACLGCVVFNSRDIRVAPGGHSRHWTDGRDGI